MNNGPSCQGASIPICYNQDNQVKYMGCQMVISAKETNEAEEGDRECVRDEDHYRQGDI